MESIVNTKKVKSEACTLSHHVRVLVSWMFSPFVQHTEKIPAEGFS